MAPNETRARGNPPVSNTTSNTMSSGMSTYRSTLCSTLCSTFCSTVGGFSSRASHLAPFARPWRSREGPREPPADLARQGGRRNGDPGPAPNVAADPGVCAGRHLAQKPAQILINSAFSGFNVSRLRESLGRRSTFSLARGRRLRRRRAWAPET